MITKISPKSIPRLAWIECRLFWIGSIHRQDLVEGMNISKPQATKDLTSYRTHHPDNVVYDPGPRYYIRAANFTPVYYRPDAAEYLMYLSKQFDDPTDLLPERFGRPAPCQTTKPPKPICPAVLRDITIAALERWIVDATYNGKEYRFWPMHLIIDGGNHYVKSTCFDCGKIKLFDLSRLSKTNVTIVLPGI